MIKWTIKWALRIVVLAVVGIVLLLVFKDNILRVMVERQIRAATGMDATIGRFSSGIFSPVVTVENLKLYNTPEFGGTEFIVIPEIHIEYDATAIAEQKLRIKLLRFNFAELDVVKNLNGETNIVTMLAKMPKETKEQVAPGEIRVRGRKIEFEGIDMLNVSLGRIRYLDLKHPEKNRDIPINLDNQVFPNVKDEGSLEGVLGVLWLRSNGGGSFLRPGDLSGLLHDFLNRKSTSPHKPTPASPPN
jgi:uncharacterized protein involved in outer membrane biogenesis